MLKLYGGSRSRAAIVQWYLEELGVPYEFVLLDMAAGEHLQAPYLALNPMGKVPAIQNGDFSLWESGAILLYLAEKHGQLPNTVEARAKINQWTLFANATLSVALINEATRDAELPRLLGPVDQMLTTQPFLSGAEFGVVDVALGAILAYGVMMFKLDYSAYNAISAYVEQLMARTAFKKAILRQSDP
ncbi:MAG: glutathione S-transferase [Spirulina sp. SIO3F2]|nr:glutathione S-transferase [Spirulina sp. SIO3F2]